MKIKFNHRLLFLTAIGIVSSLIIQSVENAFAAPSTVYVTVRETKLKPRAEFWAAGIANVGYGDRLSVLSTNGPWLQVKNLQGKTGYIHQSAISERKVILNSSAKFSGGNADSNDVVLAGKGFNAEVEKTYAASNAELNFTAVNHMEQNRVSPKELENFIISGQLGKRQG